MKNLFITILVLLLISLTIHSENKKKGYDILWVRPIKVGQVYFISQNLKIKYQTSTEMNKSEIDKKTIFRDIYYEAKVTVISISDRNLATCENHNIISFYELVDGKKVTQLEKGQSVFIKLAENGKEILVDNKAPDKNLFITMNQILEMNAGGPTYNETMGECKNVLPGAEWDVLKKNIIESYKAVNLIINPEAIKGKCTFEKVENDRMYFSGIFTIDPFRGGGAKDRKMISNKYTYQLFEIAPSDKAKLPIKVSKITKHKYEETENVKSDLIFTTTVDKEHTVKYFENEKEMSE